MKKRFLVKDVLTGNYLYFDKQTGVPAFGLVIWAKNFETHQDCEDAIKKVLPECETHRALVVEEVFVNFQ